MAEPKLHWDHTLGVADISFANGDIEQGDDLESLVLLSLFTDARAPTGAVVPDGTDDRRGCWLDTFDTEAFTGSQLWLLERSKIIGNEDVVRAQNYAQKALEWISQQGIANVVQVRASRFNQNKIALEIQIKRGPEERVFRYQWLWGRGD